MKKIIFTALLFMGLATVGFSQDRPQREKKTPEERAQLMTDHLAKKLSLSDKQKSEIYKINLDRAKEMDKSMAKTSAERKQAFEQQKKQFEASDEKINKVLTDDQKKSYAELKAQRMEKMKAHKGDFRKKGRSKKAGASEQEG